jgi:hypothetical protein
MSNKVTLFIQDQYGDHNLEKEYSTCDLAERAVESFKKDGGYWLVETDEETNNGADVFVPWHRVDFCRIEPVEDEGDE